MGLWSSWLLRPVVQGSLVLAAQPQIAPSFAGLTCVTGVTTNDVALTQRRSPVRIRISPLCFFTAWSRGLILSRAIVGDCDSEALDSDKPTLFFTAWSRGFILSRAIVGDCNSEALDPVGPTQIFY